MPWHFAHNPKIDFMKKVVKVGKVGLKADNTYDSKVKVLNLNVKKFKNMVKSQALRITVFQLQELKPMSELRMESLNSLLKPILRKYDCVFRDELPPGLLPHRNFDHEIEALKNAKPPYRPLQQLSPVELKAMKDYVQDLLSKG